MGDRVRLYREGVPTNDGRELRATRWEEPIPLELGGDVVGKVTNIQRSSDGWVTGVLSVEYASGLACEAGFTDFTDFEEGADGTRVANARLRYVRLGDKPCWEGMWIE